MRAGKGVECSVILAPPSDLFLRKNTEYLQFGHAAQILNQAMNKIAAMAKIKIKIAKAILCGIPIAVDRKTVVIEAANENRSSVVL